MHVCFLPHLFLHTANHGVVLCHAELLVLNLHVQ